MRIAPYLLWHGLDASAAAHPEQTALRCNGEGIDYQTLATRTNQLANTLRELGVKPGERVGVMLSKCMETLIAVHGILKAEAVVVPIDPAAPPGRGRFIVRDCALRVIVSQPQRRRTLARVLSEKTSLQVIIGLDEPADLPVKLVSWSDVASARSQAPDNTASELDLAYIMYTSGSTGDPKGLMHTHYSGMSYARLAINTYQLSPQDRISGFAPLHVDQSTLACFAAPLCGATTVMIPESLASFPLDLARLIESERISVWYSVPLMLIQLLERGELNLFDHSALRWITYGGEPFPIDSVRMLMKHWPQARWSNVYGPAEVNQCSYYHFAADDLADNDSIPIGRIWENSSALILDEDNNPITGSESGELLVRSPTMMRGYWRRPDLDARAFYDCEPLPNFHERYYRTGDLVRTRADGLLEFIGRRDRQVKIRGYRVELDEVEIALCTQPAIKEAAVLATGTTSADRKIIAAVLLHAGMHTQISEILTQLREHLPAYAHPEQVHIEARFPRTSGGKIDRQALAGILAREDH